jgi:predicted SAM-dependent methyltransferase
MAKTILDLGCGNRKRPGAIGVDSNPAVKPDVLHSLEKLPYPFETSSADEIYMDNSLEHLDDVIAVMEELHRIGKPGALVKIIVPYFRAHWAYNDPTHKRFFSAEAFAHFDPSHVYNKLYPYSKSHFAVEKVVFNETITRGFIYSFIKRVANKWPTRYEQHLSHYFPLDELSFYLKVLK